jgi:DHA1 family multidrug resistance protein-like MFS transporter
MEEMLRDSAIGQVIRFLSKDKLLQYPEERPDFVLPEAYLRALNREKRPEQIEPSNATPTITDDEAKESKELNDNSDVDLEGKGSNSSRRSGSSIRGSIRGTAGEEQLEQTKSHPLAPHLTADGHILVDWYASDDPANPQNWSSGRQNFVCAIILFYTFAVYCGSAIYTTGEEGVRNRFGISTEDASLPLSLYVLAYGVGPLIWAPLSEIPIIGRNPVYAVTFTLFVILSIPTSVVGNFAGLLVLRFLQGFFGSPCLANGAATLGDMFSFFKLPYGVALWTTAAYCGPALGPLLSGFAVMAKGWRWSLWEIVWMSAPVLVLMLLCLPETSSPNILLHRARRLRKLTGDERLLSQSEIDQKNIKPVHFFVNSMIKPIEITIKDPAILFVNIYTSLVYGIYYSFFEAFPIVYLGLHGFNIGTMGIAYTCIIVGAAIALAIYSAYIRWIITPDLIKNGMRPQEHRLIPALFACFGPPIGLFMFAWTSKTNIHWIVPTIGIAICKAYSHTKILSFIQGPEHQKLSQEPE